MDRVFDFWFFLKLVPDMAPWPWTTILSAVLLSSCTTCSALYICTSYSMHNHVGPAEYLVTAHFSLMGVDPRLTTHSCLLLPSWLQLCEKFRVNASQQMLCILQHNPRLNLNAKELKLKFITLKENTASQTYHAITLPVAQPPTSGKQLISSHSADQNQAMLYNIHFPLENISVAEPSVLPSGLRAKTHTGYPTEKKI